MHRRIPIIIGIALLIAIAASAFFLLHLHEGPKQEPPGAPTTTPKVTLTDTYKKGTHTLAGSVTVVNACQHLDASATVIASATPPVIRLDLSAPFDDGVCLELPGTKTFSVAAKAGADATITVYMNGTRVVLEAQ